MSEPVKFVLCTTNELSNLISKEVEKTVQALKEDLQQPTTDKLLTRKEVCDIFKINLTTLWKWTKLGKLQSHNIGNRVYYKSSEIDNCLTKSM